MKSIVGISTLLIFLLSINIASALIISDVNAPTLQPGKEGQLKILVSNDADEDIEDVVFSMDLLNAPFTTMGGSEDSIDKINDDDDELFAFTLRAFTDAKPGDYNIPYTLAYKGSALIKKGTIGVRIEAPVEMDFTSSVDNPVIGQKGKINLKMINRGQADARFATLTINPEGFNLLSEDRLYIGTISSDDFETAAFDVIFDSPTPSLVGTLEYTDFDNKEHTNNINLPITVYSKERAVELGILKKSNALTYIVMVVVLFILWLAYRSFRKRQRRKKSMQNNAGN